MARMPWQSPFPETRLDLLGVSIHRLTREQLLACFASALDSPGPAHFGYLNVAVSNQAADDPMIRTLLNQASLVYVDGAGVVLGCRLLGARCPSRNTGADFLPEVLRLCAAKGKTVGLLGGHPGSAGKIREIYSSQIPGLQITFVCDGFEGFEQEEFWASQLEAHPPDLLLVGLGVPKQEQWIRRYADRFPVRLYWSVGALFEYDGGALRRCPDWMGRAGLEWLYRLGMEPKRLWKRYLIGNPRFLLRCLCSRWRGRAAML
jgi:exopolysaccharide biosynthesis WecB/TagA/CpsF family protein